MEKENNPSEYQQTLKTADEREEVVLIDNENPDHTKTGPPPGFEDLLYESDIEEQMLNRAGITAREEKSASGK